MEQYIITKTKNYKHKINNSTHTNKGEIYFTAMYENTFLMYAHGTHANALWHFQKNSTKKLGMFAQASDETLHVRNLVLSLCDLKQTGDQPAARAFGGVCFCRQHCIFYFRWLPWVMSYICLVVLTRRQYMPIYS